jgi:S1-C subfamily serine protease
LSVKSKTKSIALNFIKSTIYFAFIMVVSLESPYIHKSYLRHIAQENVVRIVGMDGMGTGFHVQYKGKTFLLTNRHVCQMTGPLKAEIYGEKMGIERHIVKISDKHDLCLMEPIPGHKGIPVSDEALADGDSAYTLGHPRGQALNIASGEKFDDRAIPMAGEVKADGTCEEGQKQEIMTLFGPYTLCAFERSAVQFSTPTFPGNSGSPVVNKYGYLVSVIFAGEPRVESQGFGVPLSYITEFLETNR